MLDEGIQGGPSITRPDLDNGVIFWDYNGIILYCGVYFISKKDINYCGKVVD